MHVIGKHRQASVFIRARRLSIFYTISIRRDSCHQALIMKENSGKYLDVYLDKWLAWKTRVETRREGLDFKMRNTENTKSSLSTKRDFIARNRDLF